MAAYVAPHFCTVENLWSGFKAQPPFLVNLFSGRDSVRTYGQYTLSKILSFETINTTWTDTSKQQFSLVCFVYIVQM